MYAYHFSGTRYDVGEKLGFILTSLEFALRNDELRTPLLQAINEIIQREISPFTIG